MFCFLFAYESICKKPRYKIDESQFLDRLSSINVRRSFLRYSHSSNLEGPNKVSFILYKDAVMLFVILV